MVSFNVIFHYLPSTSATAEDNNNGLGPWLHWKTSGGDVMMV